MESQTNKLKNKYWEGNTSLEEEIQLKKNSEESSSNSLEEQYFDFLKKEKQKNSGVKFYNPAQIKINRNWLYMAASIIMIFGISLILNFSKPKSEYLVEDPQEAYRITKAALLTISTKMNSGAKYAGNLDKFYDTQTMIIDINNNTKSN